MRQKDRSWARIKDWEETGIEGGWGGGRTEARKWVRDKVKVGQQSGEIDQNKGRRDIGGERPMGKMSRGKGWD